MRAFEKLQDFEGPAFMRMVHAMNTPAQKQAELEYEAISALADKVYLKSMKRISKKYPGVPFP